MAIDQPDTGLDRIDAEPGPSNVEERQSRQDVEFDQAARGTLAEVTNRALEDERRSGNGVQNLAVVICGGDEPIGDLDVDIVERVG